MKKQAMGILICIMALAISNTPVHAMGMHTPSLGQRALMVAMERLSVSPFDDGLALVTNAGYVTHQGSPTGDILDTVTRLSSMGRGNGTLLSIHARTEDPLFMVFVHKKGPQELAAVSLTTTDNTLTCSEVFNLWVGPGTSFAPFQEILGSKAFAIITLANGCYDSIPEPLIQAALFHDHFCCGVATGYFTAGFILSKRPLRDGESYTYIGVPSWCQDDYVTHRLNLTPGKKGYLSMIYPSKRPWNTEEATYTDLSGIVIRFNKATGTGDATVLSYAWKNQEFIESLGDYPADINWRQNPWLHVCYNRYVFQNEPAPETFVSAVKTIPLNNPDDFQRLTRLGANPLAEILGEDASW